VLDVLTKEALGIRHYRATFGTRSHAEERGSGEQTVTNDCDGNALVSW